MRCDEGGSVITMDMVQLDVSNPCSELAPIGGSPEIGSGSDTTAGKKKCSLTPEAPWAGDVDFIFIVVAALVIVIAARRIRRSRVCRF